MINVCKSVPILRKSGEGSGSSKGSRRKGKDLVRGPYSGQEQETIQESIFDGGYERITLSGVGFCYHFTLNTGTV